MNEGLKHRIIGILVLVALSLVFLPMLFDFDRHKVDTRSQIPLAPEIAPVEISEPVRPQGIEAPKPDTEIFQPRETPPPPNLQESEPKEPPSLTEEGIPLSWVLQVGSFQEQEKAETLTAQLQHQGYKAYTRAITRGGKTLHRVFVGPKISQSRLLEEKTAIDKKYGVNSLVLEFEP